jgi:hypothetical protein
MSTQILASINAHKITTKLTKAVIPVELTSSQMETLAPAHSMRFGMDQVVILNVQLASIEQETDALLACLISISVLIR